MMGIKNFDDCATASKFRLSPILLNTMHATPLTDLLVDCLRRERHDPAQSDTVRITKFDIHRGFPDDFCPKWAQYQLENHYMVILTITKFRSDVNDFQNSINILLIINNLHSAFLGSLISSGYVRFEINLQQLCKAI